MLAYRLRHVITFQEPVHTQDPTTGEDLLDWQDVVVGCGTEVPAEVLLGPGREFRQSGTTQSSVAARINLRWFPDLDTSWRILWDGLVFNIASKETDLTARQEWRLVCTAGVNDGE